MFLCLTSLGRVFEEQHHRTLRGPASSTHILRPRSRAAPMLFIYPVFLLYLPTYCAVEMTASAVARRVHCPPALAGEDSLGRVGPSLLLLTDDADHDYDWNVLGCFVYIP